MSERFTTIESEQYTTAEKIGLPTGFITEKGSVYSYNADGSLHRDKYDGTQSNAGIAVFIEPNSANQAAFKRMGAVQDHLPPENQRRAYILQISLDANGKRTGERIYKASDIQEDAVLAFALIDKNERVVSCVPASIQPQLGSMVFEMDKLPDGTSTRHPGHQVVDIIE